MRVSKSIAVCAWLCGVVLLTDAAMTAVEPALLNPLAQVGGVQIANEVAQASQTLQAATDQMNEKITYCNGIMQTYSTNCVNCIKQKCEDKARSCGKELTFSGVINTIADFGSNVINTITDIGSTVIDVITDTGKQIVDTFKKITGWGRRRRNPLAREPSCSQFSNADSAAQACLWYQSQCSYCSYEVNRDCPGYTSTKAHYDSTLSATAWLQKIGSDRSYQVEAVSYDSASFDAGTQAWRTVSVTVNLFGRRTTFYANTPINPFNAAQAGLVIADQALAWYKVV